MKKMNRILSVALVAALVLSLSAVALADTPSVYIPQRQAKQVSSGIFLEDYVYPALSTKVTDLAVVKDKNGNKVESSYCTDPANPNGMAYVKSITEDSVMQFQFDERPDWFSCKCSSLDGGTTIIDIDESGYGELEVGELRKQPTRFIAGKDYGDYSVDVYYNRDGSEYAVAVTLKDGEDVFRTGMEGAVVTYTFEKVNVVTQCAEDSYYKQGGPNDDYMAEVAVYNGLKAEYDNAKKEYEEEVTAYNEAYKAWVEGGSVGDAPAQPEPFTMVAPVKPSKPAMGGVDVWYCSQIAAAYPAGNYIAAVEVNYRNDKKNNAYDYKISYAVNETETYKITYAVSTSTVLEEKYKTTNEFGETVTKHTYTPLDGCGDYLPSTILEKDAKAKTGKYLVHYSADQAIYGEYYRNGSKVAVSGSGDKLNKWYAPGHGKQVKSVKKGTTSFKSPRVY